MRNSFNHTLNTGHFPWLALLTSAWLLVAVPAVSVAQQREEEDIQIIEGEDRVIYEYRQNGVLTMIKVVPKRGRPYYMVPADGTPHYESLDHKRQLYPQWVIIEF